ncbi:hypothetical protein B0920_01390 [Massilia sp. KIM]|nr:hypothetical protein B0920_01390 [Massilia sp. KIM]
MNFRPLIAGAAALLASGTLQAAPAATDPNTAVPSAKAIRGASTYVELEKEPPPKLIVDDPLPEGLAQGIVWIQYRVENLRIVPVFGKGATQVSPRVGHLHITVDNLPWWWADASDNNTIDIAGLPAGEHTVRIELVNPNHKIYDTKIVKFHLPVAVQHEFHEKHKH